MNRRVAVLMGGISAEREVSLVSGRAVAEGLREAGYDVVEIDVGKDVGALLKALTPAPDVAFNALHGRFGEDGSIQGLLDLLGIPYTHSGVLASAIAMDKPTARKVFASVGIRVPEGQVIRREDVPGAIGMDPPFVLKPINEGSSVGVHIVFDDEGLASFKKTGWPYGDELLVERYIPGHEITVAVLGNRALGVLEIRPNNDFYDYGAKYTDGKAVHLMPAPMPKQDYRAALDIALLAHRTLGCRGVSRADLRYDDSGSGTDGIYLLEVNTQPGMTPLSLVPEIAAHAGIPFPQLVARLVEEAQCAPRPG